MRVLILIGAVLLAGCTSGPVVSPKVDPTDDAEYRQSVEQLTDLSRRAESLLRSGKLDAAGALITKGQPLMHRVLAVSKPTLGAMEAASDLDYLYGRMLLTNRNYGWARLLFQKNLARWKNWQPQTEDTNRRRKQAESAIAECDRALEK